jgi:hypothetical protein
MLNGSAGNWVTWVMLSIGTWLFPTRLHEDPAVLAQIKSFFDLRQRPMPREQRIESEPQRHLAL